MSFVSRESPSHCSSPSVVTFCFGDDVRRADVRQTLLTLVQPGSDPPTVNDTERCLNDFVSSPLKYHIKLNSTHFTATIKSLKRRSAETQPQNIEEVII